MIFMTSVAFIGILSIYFHPKIDRHRPTGRRLRWTPQDFEYSGIRRFWPVLREEEVTNKKGGTKQKWSDDNKRFLAHPFVYDAVRRSGGFGHGMATVMAG
jgi:hypothetical protein